MRKLISMPKPVCIIPARGGSKGVERKNIKNLGGKPLIAYFLRIPCIVGISSGLVSERGM